MWQLQLVTFVKNDLRLALNMSGITPPMQTFLGLPNTVFVFGISVTNVVIWHYFGKDCRQILKKEIFHPRVPLWFSGDLSTSFWAKGVIYFWARELWFSPNINILLHSPSHECKKIKLQNLHFITPSPLILVISQLFQVRYSWCKKQSCFTQLI